MNNDSNKYILMHKNHPVVEVFLSNETGEIESLGDVHDHSRLPLSTTIISKRERGGLSRGLLNKWWVNRSIPASRDGLSEILLNLGIRETTTLLEKCFGLSLSDHYWICPDEAELKWENVNFFTNSFSEDVGEMLFGHDVRKPDESIDFMSPDNSSDGVLKKRWIIKNGKRMLMKGGSGDFLQEPYNEVIASEIMRRLGIEHVNYSVEIHDKEPFSLCETFVTPETELISAEYIYNTEKKSNNDSDYTHLLRCCENLNIPGVESAIDKMLTVDYIIANTDRHWRNFGFIRNVDTLEWLGFSPIYDSGTSLWCKTNHVGKPVETKTFYKEPNRQIRLIKNLSWFNRDALVGIDDFVNEILAASEYISEERRTAISKIIPERADVISRRKI